MTWVRLDDGFWCNEKVVVCSDAALGLYTRGLSYAAQQRTDGRLSAAALKMLRASRVRVAELLRVGLWDELTDGISIHDYLKYNPSVSELDSRRDSKSIAGAKGAASRWHHDRNAPVPDPSRTHPDPPPAVVDAVTRCVRAYDGLKGTLATTPPILMQIQEWHGDGVWAFPEQGAEWFEKACGEAAKHDKRNLAYVMAILKRWRMDGGPIESKRVDKVGIPVVPGEGGFDFAAGLAALNPERAVGEVRTQTNAHKRESDGAGVVPGS